MTNHVIDNSLKNLGKAILWQYDKAVRLLSVIKHMQVMYHVAVEQFWDYWRTKVLSIDSCGEFGNAVWGIFLGVPNPTIIDDTGTERFIVPAVYRKVLKGAFYLAKASGSFNDILGYLEIVFGIDGKDNLTKWNASVSEYGWTTNIDELNFAYEADRAYPKDYVFWYSDEVGGIGSNWKCKTAIPGNEEYQSKRYYKEGDIVWHKAEDEDVKRWKFNQNVTAAQNTSFEAIYDAMFISETTDVVNTSFDDIFNAGFVEETSQATTGSEEGGTRFFKLIDPEGIVRKITGGNSDALKMEIVYEFGDITITATATRRRKCGVMLTDNGDMSMKYSKSPYYNEMLRDQKYLFEQKLDEICPYPLGIKTNEPVETWIFGFDGQQPSDDYKYATNRGYAAGDVVWYVDEDGHGFWWKFIQGVSAGSNQKFEDVRPYVEKTDKFADGSPVDPLVSGIVDSEAFDSPTGSWVRVQPDRLRVVILANSLILSKQNDVPTEFLTGGTETSYSLIGDGITFPIQTEIWDNALAEKLQGTAVLPVAYNNGEMRSGVYYRADAIVKIKEGYRYITKGGTFNDDVFSGETCPADKTTLWEKN